MEKIIALQGCDQARHVIRGEVCQLCDPNQIFGIRMQEMVSSAITRNVCCCVRFALGAGS